MASDSCLQMMSFQAGLPLRQTPCHNLLIADYHPGMELPRLRIVALEFPCALKTAAPGLRGSQRAIGKTISGVFGSVFLIKSFGRFGFDPTSISSSGNINFNLFLINIVVSFLGGAIAVILIQKLKRKLNTMNHLLVDILLFH